MVQDSKGIYDDLASSSNNVSVQRLSGDLSLLDLVGLEHDGRFGVSTLETASGRMWGEKISALLHNTILS